MEPNSYDQQESRLSLQSSEFLNLLQKRGLIEDQTISGSELQKDRRLKQSKIYHNTFLLLRHYQDICWVSESFPETLAQELDAPLKSLDVFLSVVNDTDMSSKKVESRLQSIEKSRLLSNRLNDALTVVKQRPGNGSFMYDVIYLTYIQHEVLRHQEIVDRLHISSRQYYRLREQVTNLISIRLWSVPSDVLGGWLEITTLVETFL